VSIPLATISSQSLEDSASLPSHHTTDFGSQSLAISSTHSISFRFRVGGRDDFCAVAVIGILIEKVGIEAE
jgi:hypothetical protein